MGIQVNTVPILMEEQILTKATVQHWNTVSLTLIPKQDSVQGISVNQDGWDKDVSTVGETTDKENRSNCLLFKSNT